MNEIEFTPQNITTFLKNSTLAPVILCIGTDRVCGDALGPLIGTMLTDRFNTPSFVYGTLSSPVTALNLKSAVDFIKSRHPSSPVIAVDSCVGKASEIGKIRLFCGGIKPGLATGKDLPRVGDISITATVAQSGNESSLFKVSLSLVYELSLAVAKTINQAVHSLKRNDNSTIYKYNTIVL